MRHPRSRQIVCYLARGVDQRPTAPSPSRGRGRIEPPQRVLRLRVRAVRCSGLGGRWRRRRRRGAQELEFLRDARELGVCLRVCEPEEEERSSAPLVLAVLLVAMTCGGDGSRGRKKGGDEVKVGRGGI
jgi:hypothetical protein